MITERGIPVAKLIPISQGYASPEERIRRLEESGILEPAARDVLSLPPHLRIESGIAQRWLRKDRGG